MRRLVLWDIDGTLVSTAPHGRDAFAEAFAETIGHAPGRLVPMAGRTDHEIALEVLSINGVEDGEGHLHAVIGSLAERLAAKQDDIRRDGHAMPGAAEVICALAEREGVVQSLLTGNIEPNAAVKLAAFGLGEHIDFAVGGYGSDHRMRGQLVAIAQAKVSRRYGFDFGRDDTVLVGDTPLDVAAGREGGARVVGVATGPYGVEDLRSAGAHAVLPDLSETGAALEAILGSGDGSVDRDRTG